MAKRKKSEYHSFENWDQATDPAPSFEIARGVFIDFTAALRSAIEN
jgi:hypothetical protein